MPALLYRFNSISQLYGDFISALPWTHVGTGTFKRMVGPENATRGFESFTNRLGRLIKCPVAYFAVLEKSGRWSGVGLPKTAPHWHFLLGCPEHREKDLIVGARQVWCRLHGNVDIREYDPKRAGAYYVSKTAGNEDFDFLIGNLDRLQFSGSSDPLGTFQKNPYVPPHVKSRPTSQTLVVRDPSTKLPSSYSK